MSVSATVSNDPWFVSTIPCYGESPLAVLGKEGLKEFGLCFPCYVGLLSPPPTLTIEGLMFLEAIAEIARSIDEGGRHNADMLLTRSLFLLFNGLSPKGNCVPPCLKALPYEGEEVYIVHPQSQARSYMLTGECILIPFSRASERRDLVLADSFKTLKTLAVEAAEELVEEAQTIDTIQNCYIRHSRTVRMKEKYREMKGEREQWYKNRKGNPKEESPATTLLFCESSSTRP